MGKPYLEVTYRQGKPLAAYLYLDRRPGDKAVRSERRGSFVIDFSEDNRAIGIEFTSIADVDLEQINRVLTQIHHAAITPGDLAPLTAA